MIEALLRRPVSVIVATIAVCALGVFSLLKLPLSLLPSIERPKIVITARAEASSRDEMLHDVTEPLERRLSAVSGITSIESETRDGESRIEIGTAWQTDPDRLRIDVARRTEGVTSVPLDELTVDVAGSDVASVVDVAVTGASGALRTRLAQRVVLPELARLEGAGKIELIGASPLRVTVQPLAAALTARGLTAADVEDRLRATGSAVSAGRVREGAMVRPLVVVERVTSLESLRALNVRGVPLGEIANVALREVPDPTAFRMLERSGLGSDSKPLPGVLLRVYRAPGANAVALARSVRRTVADLSSRSRDVRIAVVADRSREVSRALVELALAALAGVLLGTIVLRYMLGSWRPTLALAVVVPVALLVSFCVFYFAGVPLDVISLAGLALATGLLVDNSIVVLESIESARAARRRDPVATGTRQILLAVVASSITLIIVFAPLLYLRGLARALFAEQAIAVVASVGASLILSLSLTPVLAQRDAEPSRPRSPGQETYLRLLDGVLRRPAPALVIAAFAIAGAFALGTLLPRELFARGSERRVAVDAQLSPDLHPDAARAAGERVWNGVRRVMEKHPATSMMMTQDARGRCTVEIEFESDGEARRALPALRTAAAQPGVRSTVRVKPSAFIEAIGGDAGRVELVASATSEQDADALARRVDAAMQSRGFRPVREAEDQTRTAMMLQWDRARPDLRTQSIERDVRAALAGLDLGQSDIRAAEPALRLLPLQPEVLGVIPVRTGDAVVPLSAIAGARLVERAPRVLHDQGRPARRRIFEPERADANVEEAVRTIALRGTERLRIAGHARERADAFGQMRLAFALAAILLLLTVAAFYESVMLPFLVMTALPFAGAGALVALLLTGQTLNVMSLIGLVFLGGIVVNHTVVLIDRAEQLRAQGVEETEAVREAARDRYRPVIMTTVTAILGMLPLALIGGDGVELRRAVAVAVIGGLITATIGTLFLVPVLHRMTEPLRRRKA